MERFPSLKVGRCLYRSAAGLSQCQSVPAAVVLRVARAWSRASSLCLVLMVHRFPWAGSRFQRLQDEPVAAEREPGSQDRGFESRPLSGGTHGRNCRPPRLGDRPAVGRAFILDRGQRVLADSKRQHPAPAHFSGRKARPRHALPTGFSA